MLTDDTITWPADFAGTLKLRDLQIVISLLNELKRERVGARERVATAFGLSEGTLSVIVKAFEETAGVSLFSDARKQRLSVCGIEAAKWGPALLEEFSAFIDVLRSLKTEDGANGR